MILHDAIKTLQNGFFMFLKKDENLFLKTKKIFSK